MPLGLSERDGRDSRVICLLGLHCADLPFAENE
jgi:hypothetical protein